MTSLTEQQNPSTRTVSAPEGGDSAFPTEPRIAVLATPVEWSDFCYACNRWKIFVALSRSDSGLVSECSGCGDVRVARFTRTNSEVA